MQAKSLPLPIRSREKYSSHRLLISVQFQPFLHKTGAFFSKNSFEFSHFFTCLIWYFYIHPQTRMRKKVQIEQFYDKT